MKFSAVFCPAAADWWAQVIFHQPCYRHALLSVSGERAENRPIRDVEGSEGAALAASGETVGGACVGHEDAGGEFRVAVEAERELHEVASAGGSLA